MRGYSIDLRERVMTAWQEGKTQSWIADTFDISVSTIKRYISRFRQKGSVLPTIQGREQPLIKDSQAAAVQAMVDEHPDATLEVYCARWKERTGQAVSDTTIAGPCSALTVPAKKR